MPEPYLLLEEPKSYQKADILDFFGIPPAPENALPKNIKAKRQFWGKRANGVGGREQANKIKNWIQKLSKILEDGEFPDQPIIRTEDGGFKVVGEPTTPAELAEQLEHFLRQGDVANVLALVSRALDRWPADPEVLVHAALALTELLRDHRKQVSGEWFGQADSVTWQALSAWPANSDAWNARARFALAVNNLAELENLDQRAQAQGVTLPAEVYGSIAAAAFRGGDTDAGIRLLIRQVVVSGGDAAVRSVATDTILSEAVIPLLPILNKRMATAYAEAVAVAAWLADGVPESQAEILGHRIWAQQAVARVFTGDPSLKSFLGILTGFLALPVYSRAMSRPGWRVLRDGPRDKITWQQFSLIADGQFIEAVHQRAGRKFEWQQSIGRKWPNRGQTHALVQQHGFTKNNQPIG
ncbi:hypothetical protein [Brevibacterium aurantiacum]|uniref:Uncharacterized protein n=1 Tax=Brevibacterium aurantiacum TaxID=273384 RepID=A0A2A3YZZ8_BREAU|nr:hypothetical protein [Brevibacterium aurantiacum]PCC44884.1 hypothetical protein CIK64_18590 [Brevibacterium aurantiacum]